MRRSGWSRTARRLLVTGGSQGARRLNDAVGGGGADLAAAGAPGLHVAGPKGEVRVSPGPNNPPGTSWCPRWTRMDLAYAAADAMCAGADRHRDRGGRARHPRGVRPAFAGEQALNARAVVEAGGGLLVD